MSDFTITTGSDGTGWIWATRGSDGEEGPVGVSRRITDVEDDARVAILRDGARELKYTGFTTEVVMADIYKPNMALPKTVICDIDGTLALHDGRGPYEFDKVESDVLNAPVGWTLDAYAEMGWTIVLLSGRQEEYRQQTERWLEKYLIPYAELHMRPEGDRRSDDIVKYELFNKVRDRHFVWLVLDDRDRCVYLWRKLGLTAFQVAPGDF